MEFCQCAGLGRRGLNFQASKKISRTEFVRPQGLSPIHGLWTIHIPINISHVTLIFGSRRGIHRLTIPPCHWNRVFLIKDLYNRGLLRSRLVISEESTYFKKFIPFLFQPKTSIILKMRRIKPKNPKKIRGSQVTRVNEYQYGFSTIF